MVFWPARNGDRSGWPLGELATIHSNQASYALRHSLPASSWWWSQPLRSLAIGATSTTRVNITMNQLIDISISINDHNLDNGTFPASWKVSNFGKMLDHRGNRSQYLNITAGCGNGKARKVHKLVALPTDDDLYNIGSEAECASPITAKASRVDIMRTDNSNYIGTLIISYYGLS